MTSRDFAYWLQGYFEIAKPRTINAEETDMIQKHLALVFFHEIDPSYTNDPKKQEEMNNIHNDPPFIKPPFNPSPSHENFTVRC